MRATRFNALKREFDEHETMLLGVKKTEYANDEDRLINFKEASVMSGLTPEHYCFTLVMKHIHAIRRVVVLDGEYEWCWSNEWGEGIKQRIADARNYILLLAALMDEKNTVIITDDDGEA